MAISERDLESGRVSPDQQQEAIQQLQSEIVKKNTERQGLLMEEKAAELARGNQLGMMRQAAGVISESMPQPSITPNSAAGISPATAGLLNKYGYSRPGTTRSQKVVSGPQAVTVNNVTTNNVSVPPVATQPIKMAQPQGDGSAAKLKTWLNNSFQQQEADTIRREQAYSRKERALARGTSKMMRSLEKIGKSVASSLDPRKLTGALGDQFGIMMKLFWFTFLANNWEKILNGITGIANWVQGVWKYFTGGEEGQKSGFMKDMITAFGGNPETETAFEAFQKLLLDDKEGLYGYIKLMMDQFFEERREAIKQVKKPDLDGMSLLDPMHALGVSLGYVGDLLAAGIGGAAGLQSSVNRQITEKENIEATDLTADNQLETYSGGKDLKYANGDSVFTYKDLASGKANIATGDASTLVSAKDERAKKALLNGDITATGDLNTKDKLAGVRQSLVAFNALETGNGAGLLTALGNLDNAARTERDGVLVRRDFLERLMNSRFSKAEIDNLYRSGDIVSEQWKLVVGDNDIRDKYKGSFVGDATERLWGLTKGFVAGAVQLGSGNKHGGQTANEGWNEALGNTDTQKRSWKAGMSGAKKLTLVPISDPRPAVVTKETDNKGTVNFFRVKSGFFNYLKKNLGADKGFTTAGGNYSNVLESKLFQSSGINRKEGVNQKYSEELQAVNKLNTLKEAHDKERSDYFKGSRLKKAEEGIKEVGSKAWNFTKDTFVGAKDWYTDLGRGKGNGGNAHAVKTKVRSVPFTMSNSASIGNSFTDNFTDKKKVRKSDEEDDEEEIRKKRRKIDGDNDTTASIDSQRSNMSSSGEGGNSNSYGYGSGGDWGEYGPNGETLGEGQVLNSAGLQERMNQAYSYLAAANTGLPLHSLAGIVGNLAHENLVGYHRGRVYWDRTGFSAGIAGFHEVKGEGELAEYMKYYYGVKDLPKGWQLKDSPWRSKIVEATKDLGKQLSFIVHRLKVGYPDVYRKLMSAKTPEEASIYFSQGYEKFAGHKGNTDKGRAELANRAADAKMIYSGKYTKIEKRDHQPNDSTKTTKLQTVTYNGKKYTVGADYDPKKETPDQYLKRKSQEANKLSPAAPVKKEEPKKVEAKKEKGILEKGKDWVVGLFGGGDKKEEKKQTPNQANPQEQKNQNQQQAKETTTTPEDNTNAQTTIDSANSNMADNSSGVSSWINNYDPSGYITPFQALSAVRKPKIDYSRLVKPRKKTDPLFSQMNQLILEVRGFTEATMNNTASTVESLNYTNIALGSIYKKIGGNIAADPATPTQSLTT